MASVEDKIVAMKFDNKQFDPNAEKTLGVIARLKQALNFSGAGKGINDLQATANKFSLNGLLNSASGIGSKFSAASVVAITAIANIVNKAVDAGVRIAKAFTLDPLKQGFQEYETNLNAVQTILANTQASGANLKDVNATLDELNRYSDQTIYNFSEMARNIGTFTAAGVDLKTSASAIKGIANLAALSGSNSQQASSAMYQLSQAISSGRVSLQDWNSVVNAGMGGTVFQRALAQTAERMGTLDKGAVQLTGKMKNVSIAGKSFRESITAKPGEESWLTSKVLTETLKQFTGDMSDAELASMGFTKAQIKNIQEQAKTAKSAATEVKTFSQLVGTLQESAGSDWAQTFQIILGDFTEAKKLWTEVNNVIGGAIGKSAQARNDMLKDWKKLGGRRSAIWALRYGFEALVSLVKPIKEAFREIFPAVTGKQLNDLTVRLMNFAKTLKIGGDTADQIKRTFAGFFAIFSIGWSIIKGLLGVLGKLFGFISSGSDSFLEVTASVGDWLVALDQAIKKGQLVEKFFDSLGSIIQVPIELLKTLKLVFKGLFNGFDEGISEALATSLGRIKDRLAPLTSLGENVAKSWSKLGDAFNKVKEFLSPLGEMIGKALTGIGDAIAKAFKAGDFNSVYDALNTVLLTGIVVLIKKFLSKGLNIDFGGGLAESIKETFGALTDTLSAMQTQIQAKTLLTIAGAIALLTISVVALSMIDSAKLTKALAGMAIAFGQLMVAMTILTKISGAAGFVKIPTIAASLILLSTAVLILTAAVKNLSSLDWEQLAKGLLGIAGLLAMLVVVSNTMGKSSGSMIRAGIAMIPLAIGIKILASAVKDFAEMSFAEIGKGLLAIAGALVIIAAAVALMPPTMIAQAAGLVVVGVALKIIGSALKDMGGMTWGEIAKGLVTLAGALLILAGGLYLMTAALPGAAALVVVAVGLAVLAPVLMLMSQMSWAEIGKGMVVLAGSLLILAGGLTLMAGTVTGSAALLIAAAALAVLTPILITLGAMSWESIGKGLVALAGAFVVLGLSSAILMPLIPAILGLSAALLLLGAAITLIGVGALGLATAFSIFVAAGSAGIAILTGMINLIPQFLSKFAEGIIGFATTIASQASKFTRAFTSLLESLIDAIITITPKLGKMLNVMIATGLDVIEKNAPKFVRTGLKILLAFLQGISDNIEKIVKVVTELLVKFIEALNKNKQKVLTAGAKFIIDFINGLARTMRENREKMNEAGVNLASAMISGMTNGLSDKAWRVINMAASVAKRAFQAAKDALESNSPSKKFMQLGEDSDEGFAIGFENKGHRVVGAAEDVGYSALDAMRDVFKNISSAMDDSVDFDPTIRPVLDLSKLTSDASKINGLIPTSLISTDVSFGQASGILRDQQRSLDVALSKPEEKTPVNLQYNQYNTSPKALSEVEIYRGTKSQLSRVKEALGI